MTSVKLMLDGIVENYTAAVLDPYLDHDGAPTGNRGMDFIDPDLLVQAVPRLDALGFQAHFHALGDRAVRLGLDAVEAARRQNGWTDTRPHLAHLQLVHPDDIPRFRRLGAAGQRPGAVGRPRRADGQADPARSSGPSPAPASTRCARSAATA